MKPRTGKPSIFMMDLLATVPYYTAYLSKALLSEGADVTVGSITYYLDTSCFQSRGIRLCPGLLDVVGRFNLPRLPRRILKMVEAAVNLFALTIRFLISQPDIFHVQFLPMLRWRMPLDLWFVRFFQHRGSRVVLTVHDLLPHDTGNRYKPVFLDLYSQVDAIICHSDHVAAKLQAEFSVPASKISIIPHGPFFYDVEPSGSNEALQEFGIVPDQPMFLFQGILLPYKGVDLLLNAWARVEEENPTASLVIAGTGSSELVNQLREQALGLALKRVHFVFRFVSTEELVVLYRAADVVVYPYRAVTTSGALATGLALGKAMVASDLSVFRELLVNGESALLVDPNDATLFASALVKLATQPDLRKTFSTRIREMHYGDRTWQSIAAQTMQTYDAVLRPSGSCRAEAKNAQE